MTWDIGKYKNPVFWPSAVSIISLIILTVTGIILALWYEPSPERAYASMAYILRYVYFGGLIQALHHWATHLLLVSLLLHMVRVFFMGTYKGRMGVAWLVGSVLLLISVLFVFSGYLLRYDELGYWSIRVTASIVGYTPLVGKGIESFILGGPEITSRTLSRFYLWHVGVLPLAALLFLGYHYLLVNKRRVMWAEVGVGFMAAGFLILFSVLYPFSLTPEISPELTSPLKPIWPFLWLYTVERYLPPSLNFVNILLLLTVAVVISGVPYADRGSETHGRKRVRTLVGLFTIGVFFIMSVYGYLGG